MPENCTKHSKLNLADKKYDQAYVKYVVTYSYEEYFIIKSLNTRMTFWATYVCNTPMQNMLDNWKIK